MGTIGTDRFTKFLVKDNGQKYFVVQKRDLWVEYLTRKIKLTKTYRSESSLRRTKSFFVSALEERTILSKEDLQKRIIDFIQNPNKKWA